MPAAPDESRELVAGAPSVSIEAQLDVVSAGLTVYLDSNGLPSEGILAAIPERRVTLANLNHPILALSPEQRAKSVYISKFVAAVASGLFDAALNYLWNETILELRNRVAQYDLSYFYDNAGLSPDKRKKVRGADDLVELTDAELIHGAKEIELISEIGFRHVDYIRFMRNWISAAHPNQNEITGLQLASWLETCVREVITLPLSSATVEIKRLLTSIREVRLEKKDAREIAVFFADLTGEQVDNLASGLFGIYTRAESTSLAQGNCRLLIPLLWTRVSEATRQGFGVRYGRFVLNNDQKEKELAREFLDIASGLEYIPESLRAAEIDGAIDQLLAAHRGQNNFYNEPSFARQLARLVGERGDIPDAVAEKYVHGLVEVFLTNGNGTAWNAEPTYLDLLGRLSAAHALLAILSFRVDSIASRLQFDLCRRKYSELLALIKENIGAPAVIELIEAIEGSHAPPDKCPESKGPHREPGENVGHRLTASALRCSAWLLCQSCHGGVSANAKAGGFLRCWAVAVRPWRTHLLHIASSDIEH
jgi:hypothetical protein